MQLQSYGGGATTKAQKTEAQCPHGAMPGACPSCSGGGGGGGGGAKKAGLMGWNEAYAVWNSLRMAEARSQDYLQGIFLNRERGQQVAQNTEFRATLQTLWNRFSQNSAPIINTLSTLMEMPYRGMVRVLGLLQTIPAQIQARFGELLSIRPAVLDKMASLLGDAQRWLDETLHHNAEVLKSLIAQFQWQERLGQIQSLMGRVLGPFGPRQLFRTIERKLKPLLEQVGHWFESLLGKTPDPEPDSTKPQ